MIDNFLLDRSKKLSLKFIKGEGLVEISNTSGQQVHVDVEESCSILKSFLQSKILKPNAIDRRAISQWQKSPKKKAKSQLK